MEVKPTVSSEYFTKETLLSEMHNCWLSSRKFFRSLSGSTMLSARDIVSAAEVIEFAKNSSDLQYAWKAHLKLLW